MSHWSEQSPACGKVRSRQSEWCRPPSTPRLGRNKDMWDGNLWGLTPSCRNHGTASVPRSLQSGRELKIHESRQEKATITQARKRHLDSFPCSWKRYPHSNDTDIHSLRNRLWTLRRSPERLTLSLHLHKRPTEDRRQGLGSGSTQEASGPVESPMGYSLPPSCTQTATSRYTQLRLPQNRQLLIAVCCLLVLMYTWTERSRNSVQETLDTLVTVPLNQVGREKSLLLSSP